MFSNRSQPQTLKTPTSKSETLKRLSSMGFPKSEGSSSVSAMSQFGDASNMFPTCFKHGAFTPGGSGGGGGGPVMGKFVPPAWDAR